MHRIRSKVRFQHRAGILGAESFEDGVEMVTFQRLSLFGLLTLGFLACSGGNNPPSVSDISDQTVIQNTLAEAASLTLPFTVSDNEDSITALDIAAEILGPATASVSCGDDGDCELSLSVTRAEASSSAVTVTAEDTNGNKTSSSLNLIVAPRQVKSAADTGTASLRETIAEAEAGDVIVFDRMGEFAAAQTIRLNSGQLTLVKALQIEGPGADKLTLDGVTTHRLFNVKDADVTLSGMTLINGLGQDGNASSLANSIGGAIVNRSKLTLKDMVLRGNKAELGGAIYNAKGATLQLENTVLGGTTANEASRSGGAIFNEGELSLKDSTLSANKAVRYGGAIYNYEKDTVTTIEASTLSNNEAQSSSAIVNGFLICEVDCDSRAGPLTIRDSDISNNRAVLLEPNDPDRIEGNNGAVSNFGPLDIYNSRFEANEAGAGSALYNHFLAVATLDKTVFTKNVSSFNGGAIYNEGTLTLQNGTSVTLNSAANSGGGLFNEFGQVAIAEGNSVTGNSADADEDSSGTGGGVYTVGGFANIAPNVVVGNVPNNIVVDTPPASYRLRPSGISHHP